MSENLGIMSPVSVDGSEWSGINQYQKSDPPFSPTFSSRSNLATPPTSGVPSGLPNGSDAPNGTSSRPSDSGNPSPPNSEAARSSNGTLADQRSRRYKQMEEILSQHYVALKRFLQAPYREDKDSARSNKARDKLLRLSPTQFHELSTDVFDELRRRQQAMPPPGRPPRPDVPPFLQPRPEFHEKRNQARQKLASLQHKRFKDLATDVYYELERRFPHFTAIRGRPSNGYPSGGYGYPPPPGGRSQSRGPPSRMGRGYPSGPGSPMGFPPRQASLASMNDDGPLPKSFQSNTMVPNKSTMVEDDDEVGGLEDDYDVRSDAFALDGVLSRRGTTTTMGDGERKLLADSQSQVAMLQEKVDKLEGLVKSKDDELSKYQSEQDKAQVSCSGGCDWVALTVQQVSATERQEWEELKQELEGKVYKAEDLNSSLQMELEKVRTEHDNMERDLRSQLDAAPQGGGDAELQARFADLEFKHQGLQAELQEQQQVTEEVRREATRFLTEMKVLSEQSHTDWEREERLAREVQRLEDEARQWKNRYTKAKTQLRHLRASSVGISESHPDVGAYTKENELLQDNGLVRDIHVTKFQISVDDLLRVARFDEHQLVLQQVRMVIVAVRHILEDLDMTRASGAVSADLLTKAKTRVSGTANNLITACKNFSNSSGLSPVSLLDAAASHLATAVIEVIRLVKIQPTPASELEEDDEEQIGEMKSLDYFSVPPSQRRVSNSESVYSAMSAPSGQANHHPGVPDTNGGSSMQPNHIVQAEDHEHQEVKLYVEDQTEGLVQSIQALVASIRAEESLTAAGTHVSAISSVVTNVVSSTEHLINKPGANPSLQGRCAVVLQTLDSHRYRLQEAMAEGETASSPEQVREAIDKLPPIAFAIARETKDLVQQLEPVQPDEDEDDFR